MRHQVRIFAAALMLTLIIQGARILTAEAALPQANFTLNTQETASFKEAFRNSFPVAEHIKPFKKDPRRLGVELTAPSAIVVDAETGRVLFSKNATENRTLASISKLMFALVYSELKLDPKTEITMAESDRQAEGKYHFEVGDTFKRGELFNIALGASSNNVVAALVRTSGLSKSQFIEKMNEKAKELNIEATFVEPTGLNAENQSTAIGVSKLLRAAMQVPEIRKATTSAAFQITSKQGRKYRVDATDQLIGTFLDKAPYDIIGGKTGFIDEAGYCLALTVNRNGHEIDIVVLGAKEHLLRFQEVKSLAVWTFDAFSWE